MSEELEKFLVSVEKPLLFASKDNFSNIDRVTNLGEAVRDLCTKALAAGLAPRARDLATSLRDSFSDFEKVSSAAKKKKISDAIATARALRGSSKRAPASRAPSSGLDGRKKTKLRDETISRSNVAYVKGVGPKVASLLAKRSVLTVEDLLFYSPRKYDDRRNITPISEILPDESYTVRGKVVSLAEIKKGRTRFFQVAIRDESRSLSLTWFNYKAFYLRGFFRKGMEFIVHGKVSLAPGGRRLQIIHPLPQDIEMVENDADVENSLQFGRIVPVYPLTEGLSQKKMREAVRNALDAYAGEFDGLIPADVRGKRGLINLSEALEEVHFPADESMPVDFDDAGQVGSSMAHRTVIFFEFFILQLGLFLRKRKVERSEGISFSARCDLAEELVRSLPFDLTGAQQRAVAEIASDMVSAHPMNRLLQGDVGSGKTLVAFLSMLRAVESGYQAAFMVPTEILAEQHFRNMNRMAAGMDVEIRLLKSDLSAARKSGVHKDIRTGNADIVVGTHALISDDVDFKALGFVVIDEQHRFGVLQRARLVSKGAAPDMLVMTATPIPRTLAITVYGDLEISVIDELPPSRKEIKTLILPDTAKNRTYLYDSVKRELELGRQAYFVYPFIEQSENPDFSRVRHVTGMMEELLEKFREFRVKFLHGRMKTEQREEVMTDFAEGLCDILVSTTVIEVGVDVPNANVIVIENAERFGLSQLHQMRGRVGRGEHESFCFITHSFAAGEESKRRLQIMGETTDGFRISESDLAQRGPGEFMGTRQSGVPGFSFANLVRDSLVLDAAREAALELAGEKNDVLREHERLFKLVSAKWADMLELDTSS